MTQYDAFAKHYDQVVGDRSDVARLFMVLLREFAPKARSVLELGCGSGTMLRELSARYATTGIDNSRAMLRLAATKALRAKTLFGDIRRLDLNTRYDAIVCPFDTMNHVTNARQWREVFRGVHAHLAPGGVFIFDVNTESKMELYCADPVTVEYHPRGFSTVQVRRVRAGRYDVTLSLFSRRRNDLFKRSSMTLPELIIPLPAIRELLKSFFASVTVIDPGRRRPSRLSEELYIVCREPHRLKG